MQPIICILLSARSLGRCYMLSGVWITAVSDNIDRPLSRVTIKSPIQYLRNSTVCIWNS